MRKHTIIGVIVLMSISLLGVVGVQLYWINNAIKVKQQLFERNVHDALANVVDKLETREALSVVTTQMASLKSTDSLATVAIKETPAAPSLQPAKPTKVKLKKTPQKPSVPSVSTVKGTPVKEATPIKGIVKTTPATQVVVVPPFTKTKLGYQNTYVSRADSFLARASSRALHNDKDVFFHTDTVKGRRDLNRFFTESTDTALFRKLVKGQPYRAANSMNAAAAAQLIDHKLFRISADTLRHLTLSLDTIKAIDVSSIRVENDSVFIYKQGSTKPVYVYKPTKNATNTFYKVRTELPKWDSVPVKIYSRNIAQERIATATTVRAAQAIAKQTSTVKATKVESTPVKPSPAILKAEAVQKIENKKEKLNDVVQQMMVEYVVRDIPLKERLNKKNLQALLSDELRDKGIDLDYGYHVVSADNDTVVDKRAGQIIRAGEDTKYFATFLFPNDIVEKPDYLAVYFPDTQAYAIRSLAGMMSLSGLFTLIIIATFATTIHIIYKQKRLSEMKNDFINNMTHEFKTPIATISLATDSIFNPKVYDNPEKIKYYTSIIREENKRMDAQVENVLQIALLEKNEFRLNLQPIDVHLLILKATESIRFQVEQRLGKISVNLQALHHELQTDEMHLFNVICNLLDNANKYSPATPEIELSTQNIAGGLLIAVDDKGMGMSKDTQQRVFEKFYRVPTGNLHNVKGFGLGLSYVKAIVEAHHGTIKLWSEPGKGSRFQIFLPLRK